jgi:hypothetical protein
MDGELAGTPFCPLRLHRIYRLIVVREDKRVRLITRNGHDWSDRFPWIVKSALQNRQKHFVIDGEAVVLGVDGSPDFNALPFGNRTVLVVACMRLRARLATSGSLGDPPGVRRHLRVTRSEQNDRETTSLSARPRGGRV